LETGVICAARETVLESQANRKEKTMAEITELTQDTFNDAIATGVTPEFDRT